MPPDFCELLEEKNSNSGNAKFVNTLLFPGFTMYVRAFIVFGLLFQSIFAIQSYDANGYTSLHLAVKEGDMTLAMELIDKGTDIDVITGGGETPFHLAVKNGASWEVIAKLLEKGANLHATDFAGNTALHYAVFEKRLDLIKPLIDKGLDVDVLNNKGMTPLHYAVMHNQPEIITLLLDLGAQINRETNEGETPLELALSHEHWDMLRLLYQKGAVLNPSNIQQSLGEYDLATFKFILELGLKANSRDSSEKTPLHHIITRWYKDPLEKMDLLLKMGADINAQDDEGNTPLHCAARSGDTALIVYLLEHGADKTLKNKMDATPYDLIHYSTSFAHARKVCAPNLDFPEREKPVIAVQDTDKFYINPKIAQELVSWISDGGDQLIGINTTNSESSAQYFIKDTDSNSIDYFDEGNMPCYFMYAYVGKTDNDVHGLITYERSGGTGVFMSLLLLTFQTDYGIEVDWENHTIKQGKPRRQAIKVGEIGLGDRWIGDISIDKNKITVSKDEGFYENNEEYSLTILPWKE